MLNPIIKVELPDGSEIVIDADEGSVSRKYDGEGTPGPFTVCVKANALKWLETERAIAMRYLERQAVIQAPAKESDANG